MDNRYLKKRRQTWYAQLRVPAALVPIIGKPILIKTLGTRDIHEARKRRHATVAKFQAIIEQARQLAVTNTSDTVGMTLNHAALLRHELRAGLITQAEAEQDWEILLNRLDWIPEDSVSNQQSASIRAAGVAISDPSRSTLLSDAIKLYYAEDEGRLRKATLKGRQKRLTDFQQWLGDQPLDSITRKQAGQYVTEVLQRSHLQVVTVKHIIGMLYSFFGFFCGRGQLEHNPFEGVSKTVRPGTRGIREEADSRRRPYTTDELTTLLGSTPCTGDLWMMTVLGLYTGMRINELAEVQCKDVNPDYIHVASGKTKAAIRDVPIHPIIEPLITHLTGTDSDEYMISGLMRGGYDAKRNHDIGRRFSRYKKHTLQMPDCVVFHSLRHNFTTALEQAQVPLPTIQLIVGHHRPSEAHGRYSDGLRLDQLSDAVNRVTYGEHVDELVAAGIAGLVDDEVQTLKDRKKVRSTA